MGQRSTNRYNGTLQDITHICSSMEQLLLSYKLGKIPYIYIVNFLELLFQSARTRICVLREPPCYENSAYSINELDKLVVFATFRRQKVYKIFLEQLSSRIFNHGSRFFEQECELLEGDNSHFYICLSSVYPEGDKFTVNINRSHNKEAYRRLTTMFHILTEETCRWGLDIPLELYNCFNSIPEHLKAACKLPYTSQEPISRPLPQQPGRYEDISKAKDVIYENFTSPINKWVEDILNSTATLPWFRFPCQGI